MAALSFSPITSRLESAGQCKSRHVPKLIGAPQMVKFLGSRMNSSGTPIRLHGGNISEGRVCASQATAAVPSGVEKVDFNKLQNGSDIRGVAVAGVEGEPVNLTAPVAEAIGTAFVHWLLAKKKSASVAAQLVISIGHDSRISASSLEEAIARGITNAGAIVVLYGLASTPAMFNSTVTQKDDLFCPADGAIMITASHLPYNRNGFKFFVESGGLGKADISDILSRASDIYNSSSTTSALGASPDTWKRVNFMDHYAGELVKAVRNAAGGKEQPLEGFHIVVDAGNGAGGFFAEKVLQPLGAVTEGSQFLEPDGMFPNHIPNPEDKSAMEAITGAVLKHKADLGIIFDTDVDRSAAVDSSGRELNRNRLIALISAIILDEHPGTTIVTDSVTSDGLTDFIEKKLGGKHHRFKRGYKNVIDEGIRLNAIGEETHLAMETSGHGALKENRWLDDGAYLMVKLLIKLAAAKAAGEGQGSSVLTNLIRDLEEVDFATELRLKINESHPDIGSRTFREYGDEVLRHLEASLSSNSDFKKPAKNFEGVRASGYGGFFLLRLSLHDPVLPLNIEATTQEGIQKLASFVLDTVSGFKALDVSSLAKFLNR